MPKLSIIVPIYKVEPYLGKCIDSILAQTYRDFECILIDDGSPDRCGEIADKYANLDTRIHVIHQNNFGVSSARNTGLGIARGIYIGFVDPDDWIEPRMYEMMIHAMECETADIICCNWNDAFSDGTVKKNIMPLFHERMNHSEFINHLFDIPYSFLGVVWNKLFKREMIHFGFPVGCAMGEDTLFTMQYAQGVQNAYYLNSELYNVFARPESTMRANPEKMAEGLVVWEQIIDLVKNEEQKTQRLSEKMYVDKCLLYSKLSGEVGKSSTSRFRSYLRNHFVSVMVNREIYWKTRINYARLFLMKQ